MSTVTLTLLSPRAGLNSSFAAGDEVEVGLLEAARMIGAGQAKPPEAQKDIKAIKAAVAAAEEEAAKAAAAAAEAAQADGSQSAPEGA